MVAAAVIGSAVVGAVASSAAQKSAANTAAGAQTNAANSANAVQQQQYANTQRLLNPYVQAGSGSPGTGSVNLQALAYDPGMQPYYARAGVTPEQWLAAAQTELDQGRYGRTPEEQASIMQRQLQAAGATTQVSGFIQEGTGATQGSLQAQQALIGLGGADAQRNAIQGIENSPQFAAYMQQGENAILQNASATGGLRGGNTQSALAQFRPALLSSLIEAQYAKLGGLTTLGQNSAAGVGQAGQFYGQQAGANFGQIGAANAGNALATGRANSQMYSSLGSAAGAFAGYGGFGSKPPPTGGGQLTNPFAGGAGAGVDFSGMARPMG